MTDFRILSHTRRLEICPEKVERQTSLFKKIKMIWDGVEINRSADLWLDIAYPLIFVFFIYLFNCSSGADFIFAAFRFIIWECRHIITQTYTHTHTHTHTRELCQQMRGWCPGGCVSWGYWALTKETQGRTTAANTADFTQLHTYTSRQQRADTQRETATLFRDYTQPLCVSHTKCRHTCAHTLAHTDTNTHTTQQTQFRKSIWDQETNYLNYFPFFPPSLSSTCFPAFYFSCVCICEYFG